MAAARPLLPLSNNEPEENDDDPHSRGPLAAAAERALELEAVAYAAVASAPPPPRAPVDAAGCQAWRPRAPGCATRAAERRREVARRDEEAALRAAGWRALVRAASAPGERAVRGIAAPGPVPNGGRRV